LLLKQNVKERETEGEDFVDASRGLGFLFFAMVKFKQVITKEFKIAVQTDGPDRPQSFRHEHRDDVFRHPGQ
jgi:hypothetical protein